MSETDAAEVAEQAAETVDAWISGAPAKMERVSAPSGSSAPSAEIPPWLQNHQAIDSLQQKPADQPQPSVVDSALSKLTSGGGEHSALVQSWGSDAKENLAYAFEAYKEIVANKPELIDRVEASGLGNDAILLQHLAEYGRLKADFMGDNTVSSRRSSFEEPSRALPRGASAAQAELNEIFERTPPGSPGYAKPSVQRRVNELASMIGGTDDIVGGGGRTS